MRAWEWILLILNKLWKWQTATALSTVKTHWTNNRAALKMTFLTVQEQGGFFRTITTMDNRMVQCKKIGAAEESTYQQTKPSLEGQLAWMWTQPRKTVGRGGGGELYFGGRKCASKCIESINAQNVQIVKFERTIELVDCSLATFSLER